MTTDDLDQVLPHDRYLITVAEAGRVLHLSRSGIYALIHARKLRVLHIGRMLRFRRQDIRDYVERTYRDSNRFHSSRRA